MEHEDRYLYVGMVARGSFRTYCVELVRFLSALEAGGCDGEPETLAPVAGSQPSWIFTKAGGLWARAFGAFLTCKDDPSAGDPGQPTGNTSDLDA